MTAVRIPKIAVIVASLNTIKIIHVKNNINRILLFFLLITKNKIKIAAKDSNIEYLM